MNTNSVHQLIIIGSGPAGLTAGIYAARANLQPLIFEGTQPGGQLMSTSYVENWPGETHILGPDLMIKMRSHAQSVGAQVITQEVTRVDFSQQPLKVYTADNEYRARSVIISTGATHKKLRIPGEQEYWTKGVTSCAVCDGAFFRDKKVMVVGGGDTAMEDASFLHQFTKDITVVHILDKLTASAAMQKKVLANKDIKVIYESTVTEILGDGKKVTHAHVKHQKTGEQKKIAVDGIFIAIGMQPVTALFKNQLELNSYGYIQLTQMTGTSVPGVFAAGDVADSRYRQAVTAAGTGCMAALDAQRFLSDTA